jgi:hypothetical protein
MKKFIIILIILLIIFVQLINGKKLGVLTDILKPESIEIHNNRLYAVEGSHFYVYELDQLNFLAKFGQEGEGPGELKSVSMLPNTLNVTPEKIFVDGMGKVVFFSRDFKFLKEIKKKHMTFKTKPVGENFVAMRMKPAGKNRYYFSVLLMDSGMNQISELVTQEYRETDTDIDMVLDSIHFDVYKNKIYIEKSTQGFQIAVFDSQGNLKMEIVKEIKAPVLTARDKRDLMESLKQDNLIKMMVEREGGWNNFKNKMNFIYPDKFPLIQDILVTDDKIYVATFHRKNRERQFIVMDQNGSILNTLFLPIPRESSYLTKAMGRDNRFYGIANQRYYYLIENPESEEWEIHAVDLD